MSENVFIFGSSWGDGKSYYEKNIEKKIVFINDEYVDIPKGSYIILKHKSDFKKLGISKTGMKKALISELQIFDNAEEAKEYGIDYNEEYVMYLEIDKWLEPEKLELIKKLISDSYYRIYNFSRIKKTENKKIFNEFLKINNLDELDYSNFNSDNKYYKLENLLLKNRNLILTGTPGTGKTKLAKQTAIKMIFGEDISYEEVEKDKGKKAKFEYQCKFVQFHPSYDYTDFVEGIRPVTKGDNTYGFERKDGIFKEFCKRAIVKIEDVKEFCDFVSKRISDNQSFSIKNISEQENNSPITFIEYDDNGVRVVADTKGNQTNGFSKKSYNELYEYYKKYVNNYVGLKEKSLEIFKSNVGVKEGEHTYIHGFLHAMYEYFHKPFIFIIDEINRGDINKILGELFFSIDPGYRGEEGKVETQYQNLIDSNDVFANGFYIPKNVYIIGTMNDIDRSVESIDFAIRRRFAWKEIKPEDTCKSILKNLKFSDNIEGLNSPLDIFKEFNDFIAGKDELGEMYQIGAAYFLKLNDYIDDGVNDKESIKESYRQLWNNHLKGLIHEYVRGKKSANIIFEEIENKYWELTGLNYSEINKIDG